MADADTYENPERGTLTAEQWAGLFSFVENGGGLFALHTASACWMHSCNQTVRLLLLNAFARTSGGVFSRFQWGIVWAQECQTTHTDCSSNASTAHTPQCEQSRKFHVDGTRLQLFSTCAKNEC